MWQLELFNLSNLSYSAKSNLFTVQRCSRRLLLRRYSLKGYHQTIMCFFSQCMKVVSIRPLTQRGVLVLNRVPKLHGKQMPISIKSTEKTSSQLKNSVSSGEQQLKERRGRSSVFYSFLECKCGASTWRKVKKTTLVSEARGDGNCKIVTKSDKAFALLLINYYLEKWETILEAGEESDDTEPAVNTNNNNNTADADGEANGRQKKRRAKRLPGKYTPKRKVGTVSMVGGAAWNDTVS